MEAPVDFVWSNPSWNPFNLSFRRTICSCFVMTFLAMAACSDLSSSSTWVL